MTKILVTLGIIFLPAFGISSSELFELILHNHSQIWSGPTIISQHPKYPFDNFTNLPPKMPSVPSIPSIPSIPPPPMYLPPNTPCSPPPNYNPPVAVSLVISPRGVPPAASTFQDDPFTPFDFVYSPKPQPGSGRPAPPPRNTSLSSSARNISTGSKPLPNPKTPLEPVNSLRRLPKLPPPQIPPQQQGIPRV